MIREENYYGSGKVVAADKDGGGKEAGVKDV
jgi:hypothetical protein